MDEERIKKIGSGPLLEVLSQIEKHFPAARPQSGPENILVLDEQPQMSLGFSKHRLSNTIAYLEKIGVTTLVSFSAGVCFLENGFLGD